MGARLGGVADLRYESSFVGFLKPRPKLTFGWVQGCYSYLDSATPQIRERTLRRWLPTTVRVWSASVLCSQGEGIAKTAAKLVKRCTY